MLCSDDRSAWRVRLSAGRGGAHNLLSRRPTSVARGAAGLGRCPVAAAVALVVVVADDGNAPKTFRTVTRRHHALGHNILYAYILLLLCYYIPIWSLRRTRGH